jgi:hypothetical protein
VHRITSLAAGTALALVLANAANAADFNDRFQGEKPAVSGPNGKLELGFGRLDGDAFIGTPTGTLYGVGSLSLPVGHNLGVQFDVGTSGDMGGAAFHGFWRNPESGLLGFYAHYIAPLNGIANGTTRFGGEGELYFDKVSIEAFAGADLVDTGGTQTTHFTGEILGAFYLTDNFRVHAGITHSLDRTAGRAGFEAMLSPGANNIAVFGDAALGQNAYTVRGGVKVYFGESGKSLKARHREDDPHSRLFDPFSFAGTCINDGRSSCSEPPRGPK